MNDEELAKMEDYDLLVHDMLKATVGKIPKQLWNEWRRRYYVAGCDDKTAEEIWPSHEMRFDDKVYIQYIGCKRCSRCGEYKELDQFHKRTASSDGRQSVCKECKRAEAKTPRERERRSRNSRHEPKYAPLVDAGECRTQSAIAGKEEARI